jgi:hypothetical protein
MVETSINHRKMNKNTELSILYPTSVSPPSSLEKEVLSNRQQTVASEYIIVQRWNLASNSFLERNAMEVNIMG